MRGPLAWILAAVGIVAVIVVAALIGDRDRSGETVPAGEWAQNVCGTIAVWRGEIETIVEDIRTPSSESTAGGEEPQSETPQGRTGFLRKGVERGVQAAETLVEGIDNAGVPDTEQGEEGAEVVSNWADSALNGLEAADESLDEEADSLEESLEQFAQAARALGASLAGGAIVFADLAQADPELAQHGPRDEHVSAAQNGADGVSTSDWILIALQGLVVIGFIALGVRSGGIGLGLWGGVGTLVLVFGFGLAPGEPPISAMLIIVAVIAASAAMQAAGGIDYMVLIASRALRARPKALNFAAPYVSWLLTILTGTGNTFFSLIPVINELAYANKIRPERALAGSAVASTFGITASPVAAAMATMLPLVEVYGYDIVDVMLITIPASIVGIFAMALVMNTHGKDLDDDQEYQRRLAANEIKPPAPAGEITLLPYAKRSVAIFLTAVGAICVFGVFEGLRPTIPAEGGGVEPLSVTPIIQMFMLTAAALILILAHVQASDIPNQQIFRSGMVAMIALFGIAWMADTFIANNEDAIVTALGGLAENWPFTIALAIFLVAALTTSQSAATRTMIPLGLALGIGAGYMIAFWTAVAGVLFFPANGTQIAAAEADETGSTTLGKRVIDHSFQLPLQIAWVVTALVGCLIVWLFFGDQTPPPPVPTTTTTP